MEKDNEKSSRVLSLVGFVFKIFWSKKKKKKNLISSLLRFLSIE